MSRLPKFPVVITATECKHKYQVTDYHGQFWTHEYEPETGRWHWYLTSKQPELNASGIKTLTNREAMTALLEGKKVQQCWVGGNTSEQPEVWETIDYLGIKISGGLDNPVGTGAWEEGMFIYRIEPENKTVRIFSIVELPHCITEHLK